ncbi:putative chlorophyll(ide) b reductase NYC1, chloroplastic [Artemisia annua]|uniref:Putative chlorophyll(Ide) b reductase NYC1, chloroplastic n=1 Tax=Artemisia annua TaxID=35608 RepID=A0A2U1QB93_ARTAN|nr:putative chlorophyll(ide) b reductase NYC1, chloroplastic [Artemisia annua]
MEKLLSIINPKISPLYQFYKPRKKAASLWIQATEVSREKIEHMMNHYNQEMMLIFKHTVSSDANLKNGFILVLSRSYGSTNCGLRQIQSSLLNKCRKSKVGVPTTSPAMVLIELLLRLRLSLTRKVVCEVVTVANTIQVTRGIEETLK